ncbi:hypothetical protein ABT237_40970 [Streptomyces sp. NPDC001581]|uniref:hypothetical protein n=1 Tax=Streptomyces sp. NPDC001581 TaxID=3154386 RepID=UPI00332A684E
MTTRTPTPLHTSAPLPFAAATNGWRIAFGDPDHQDITVTPIVGWISLPAGAPSSLSDSPVEPVILWDNVKDPLIGPALEYLQSNPGIYVHQVLAPGFDVREAPTGWKIMEYGDQ